jgi:hypothetical protein
MIDGMNQLRNGLEGEMVSGTITRLLIYLYI